MQKIEMELTAVDRILRPDSKGRISLPKPEKGVSGYRLYKDKASRRLVLEPQVEIPADEAWLYRNREALARVDEGLADAAAGRVHKAGSFARHLDDDE